MTGPGVTFPVVDDQVARQLNQWIYRTKKSKCMPVQNVGPIQVLGKSESRTVIKRPCRLF